jgi:putative transposase
LRPGRPRTIEDEQIAALLKRTLSRKPAAGTHWTVREAARVSGISKSTVHRLFRLCAATASHAQLQTLDRSVLRREGS